MSGDLAQRLQGAGIYVKKSGKGPTVSSCFGDTKILTNFVDTSFEYVNNEGVQTTIDTKFWIVEGLPHDIVLGLDIIESLQNIQKPKEGYQSFSDDIPELPMKANELHMDNVPESHGSTGYNTTDTRQGEGRSVHGSDGSSYTSVLCREMPAEKEKKISYVTIFNVANRARMSLFKQ